MKRIKDILKDWTIFEKCLMLFSIIIIILTSLIWKSNTIATIEALTGIYCAISQTRRKVIAQFIGVVDAILYCIVAYMSKYYGEVITHLFLSLPLYLIGIYTWITNKNILTKRVRQHKLSKKEAFIFVTLSIIMFVFIYFLLKYLNTEQLLISTICVLISVASVYLIVIRSKYGFICYLTYDVLQFFLWGIPLIKGDLTMLPLLIVAFLYFTNDIYGWCVWHKASKNKDEIDQATRKIVW